MIISEMIIIKKNRKMGRLNNVTSGEILQEEFLIIVEKI
jgi:hypothetical protein